jgi:hypothetical protein
MNMLLVIATACFLLFCHGSSHRHVKHARPVADCTTITAEWDADHAFDRDTFVKRYPADQQHRVLECLDQRGL